MADLPPELIPDILSRLPVKSLLRFRSVSKPWRALIDSPVFIKTHLNHSDLSLIIHDKSGLHSLALDSLEQPIELDHPLNQHYHNVQVWGFCNGLIFLAYASHEVFLWNPSTKRYRALPVPPIHKDYFNTYSFKTIVYGFGYDSKTDDYKVVKILQFRGLNPGFSDVFVFSLKSNSWTWVSNFPFSHALFQYPGLLASGALHWEALVRSSDDADEPSLIVAFDVGSEGFYLLPQPLYEDLDFGHFCLGVLDGCVCVLCSYSVVSVDMWVMKEYGIKESWAKLVSIRDSITVKFIDEFKPVVYSKDSGKVLFRHEAHRFIWYDLESKIIEKVGICDLPNKFEVIVCSGSLVPLGKKKQVSHVGTKRKSHGYNRGMISWGRASRRCYKNR